MAYYADEKWNFMYHKLKTNYTRFRTLAHFSSHNKYHFYNWHCFDYTFGYYVPEFNGVFEKHVFLSIATTINLTSSIETFIFCYDDGY